jgi:O-acetyl-ADP-ribose deacetylase (regulator of RNase III)
MSERLQVLCGDITRQREDAIVNAANERMLGGGGVDGAIHRAAGPALLDACRALPETRPGVRCPTGEARLTPGFALAARFVVHTVGPVWQGGAQGESELLASCYRESLRLAAANALGSIAFPAISTGVFGFPKLLASQIAVRESLAFLGETPSFERIVLVAFDADDERILIAARSAALAI